jgi:S1-C subfamily serine protease
LNGKGKVVGVNTAILSTSGSFSGIGFAVPSDQIRPFVQETVRQDRSTAFLGVRMVKQQSPDTNTTLMSQNWIATVQPNSPADQAGMQGMSVDNDAAVQYGDAIVAIGGNNVPDYESLVRELDRCVPGEQISVTLQDGTTGERRVVYLTLVERQ